MSILPKITPRSSEERQTAIKRELIRQEAELGAKLFGPVPRGHRRQFFCLDRHTWIWHEEWTDTAGKRHLVTTRYDIRPNGIFKAQDNQPYQLLSELETIHFCKAIKAYNKAVNAELYGLAA